MYLEQRTRGSNEILQTAVEVEIWEAYLVRNRTNIAKILCTYSLDNGPMNECGDGRLCFRFTKHDWDKNVMPLLRSNNIPYAVIQEAEVNVLHQLQKKNIFVAEDDPEILSALSGLLENAGYRVRRSTSGQAIIDGNFSRVDLFILDKQMPGIGGLEVCRHLRAQSDTKDTPVILISAYPKEGNEALYAGANDYLEKPVQIHYLLNLVSKYTRWRTYRG